MQHTEFTMVTLFTLIGGLALFLYGMTIMSDSLQKVAGDRMKFILGLLTKNPVLGVVAGALATAVLQSSSATTVMAIGFVSAGLMRLPQAISIIFGANIGTTITAQIIAFKLSNYIYLIIAVGFIIYFVTKSDYRKQLGLSILSFGLLFLGIDVMGGVMKPFATHPGFISMIDYVKDTPLLGLPLGTIMTLIVQSSSATVAVLQNFASQPDPTGNSVIGLEGSLPILLGDNIGTTVTAVLASIGQSKDAKRVAVAHCTFNISGAILFMCVIPLYADFVRWISPKGPEVEIISRQIANAHTSFNVIMTCIWTPLIYVMVKFVEFVIPKDKEVPVVNAAETSKILYLDNNVLSQPMAAMVLVTKETIHTAMVTNKLLTELEDLVQNRDVNENTDVVQKAKDIRYLYNSINDYLANIFARGGFSEDQAEKTAGLTSIISEIDRVASLCATVAQQTVATTDENGKQITISDDARKDLHTAIANIRLMFESAIDALKSSDPQKAEDVMNKHTSIVDLDFQMRKSHMKRTKLGECKAEMTKVYNRILHNLNRMEISCVNIADLSRSSINFQYFLSIEQAEEEEEEITNFLNHSFSNEEHTDKVKDANILKSGNTHK